MTTPTTTEQPELSLTRDLIHVARYYLGRPRVLLILATIAIVAGLVFNWSWLVAAGLAPILISTLPCLIMCVFGVCMMCRSGDKQSAPVRDAAGSASPPTTLAVAAPDKSSAGTLPSHPIDAAAPPMSLEAKPPAGAARCCQDSMNGGNSEQAIDLLLAFGLATSLAAAPALLAQDSRDHGMMDRGGMMGNGGMMGRMGSMMRMMDHCGQMMRDGDQRPNDRWRKAPSAPGENG